MGMFNRQDKSDPFFRIIHNKTKDAGVEKEEQEEKDVVVLFESEVLFDDLNPKWGEFNLPKTGSFDPFRDDVVVEVWDYDHMSDSDLIGTCNVNFGELLLQQHGNSS